MSRPCLSADHAREIRCLVADGTRPTEIAARFDVTAKTVRAIALRRTWASLPEEPGVDREAAIAAYREAAARRKAAARPGTAKLDPEKVREIRASLAAGEPGVDVGRRFGVSKATISKIRKGRSWSDVD